MTLKDLPLSDNALTPGQFTILIKKRCGKRHAAEDSHQLMTRPSDLKIERHFCPVPLFDEVGTCLPG